MENKFDQGELKIVLASASPRRKEILTNSGFKFEIITSDVDESLPSGTTATDAVSMLSARKAEAVRKICGDEVLIIGSDTLLEHEGEPLGKPKDESDAKRILMSLSGKRHFVHTGVALCYKGKSIVSYDSTAVYMKPYTEKEAIDYIKTGECMDKAGAYAIQGIGAALVEKTEGEFDTVVGFPSKLFLKMLAEITK